MDIKRAHEERVKVNLKQTVKSGSLTRAQKKAMLHLANISERYVAEVEEKAENIVDWMEDIKRTGASPQCGRSLRQGRG